MFDRLQQQMVAQKPVQPQGMHFLSEEILRDAIEITNGLVTIIDGLQGNAVSQVGSTVGGQSPGMTIAQNLNVTKEYLNTIKSQISAINVNLF